MNSSDNDSGTHLGDQLLDDALEGAFGRETDPFDGNWETQTGPKAPRMESRRGPGVVPAFSDVKVPGYEIVGELGRGGMGVVYLARHVALDRLVAVRMLRGGRDGWRAKRRSKRTRQIARGNPPTETPPPLGEPWSGYTPKRASKGLRYQATAVVGDSEGYSARQSVPILRQ